MTDILIVLFTYDRYELLKQSLETMFANPGMNFRLWVLDNGSHFTNMYSPDSGTKQLDLIIEWYKNKKIERIILNNRNLGGHYSINQLMAEAKITSVPAKVTRPDYVFQTNDDMIYEPNWLLDTYTALKDCEDYPKAKIVISSPFHCVMSNGAQIPTRDTWKGYMIKDDICGNTWFMKGETWMDTFSFFPVHDFNDGGDCEKLELMKRSGMSGVMTRTEKVHHSPEAIGKGKYNRLGHW